VRLATYGKIMRRDLLKLSGSCGLAHPALIDAEDIEVLNGTSSGRPLREVYGYEPDWGRVSDDQAAAIREQMSGAPVGGSAPLS
jgi:hypothetical protein